MSKSIRSTRLLLVLCCMVQHLAVAEDVRCDIAPVGDTGSLDVRQLQACIEPEWACGETGCDAVHDENHIHMRVLSTRFEGNTTNLSTFPKNVYSLSAPATDLRGTLPSEWSESLRSLEYLDVSNNRLTGSLPAAWSALTGLTYLNLSYTHLTGPLPAEWRFLKSLQTLDLRRTRLNTRKPAEWAAIKNIKIFPSPPQPHLPRSPTNRSLPISRSLPGPPVHPLGPSPLPPATSTLPSPSPPITQSQHRGTAGNFSPNSVPYTKPTEEEDPRQESAFRIIAMVAGSLVLLVVAAMASYIVMRRINGKDQEQPVVKKYEDKSTLLDSTLPKEKDTLPK